MLKIEFTGPYYETLQELLKEQPDLSAEIDRRVKLFLKNSKDTRLYNHSLTGRLEGRWAFSITSDIRIVYEILGKNTVRFLAIGGHAKVYGKSGN